MICADLQQNIKTVHGASLLAAQFGLAQVECKSCIKKKGFNTQQTHIYNRIEESVSVQMIDIVFFNLTRTTFPIMPVMKSVSYAALDCSRLLI